MLGAIAGDIVGSRFEYKNHKSTDFELFEKGCDYTDDTICTVAVADWLLRRKYAPTGLEIVMQKWCRRFPYPTGAYGTSFFQWIWDESPEPYYSFGNGSAMRVSPVGWVFTTLNETLNMATDSAHITHNHPEGIKGAQAVAAAIYLARTGRTKEEIMHYIQTSFGYDLNHTCGQIRSDYQFNETCQHTVPEAIIAFLESTGYENAIRLAVSLGGDSDTLACITGGIAEAFYGLPNEIKSKTLSFLPEKLKLTVKAFYEEFIQPKLV